MIDTILYILIFGGIFGCYKYITSMRLDHAERYDEEQFRHEDQSHKQGDNNETNRR